MVAKRACMAHLKKLSNTYWANLPWKVNQAVHKMRLNLNELFFSCMTALEYNLFYGECNVFLTKC